ncbi:MAG: nuclear transport factor 2 family protein [candidate division WOR-3 bacterium]|nr:MAG: nuclear transport factor 2 family protein [candidate division WOR-3 bacterium]
MSKPKNRNGISEEIIACERAALDRWGRGDPGGFTEISADEVTYFDPGTEKRVDGIGSLRQLYAPIEGKIKIDRYEMLNPKVQVHGDTAVLTFNLIDYTGRPEGSRAEGHWNATEVYCRINGQWKIIHTHWSYTKKSS